MITTNPERDAKNSYIKHFNIKLLSIIIQSPDSGNPFMAGIFKINPVMIKGMQEQQQIIVQQQQTIDSQQEMLDTLLRRIEALESR